MSVPGQRKRYTVAHLEYFGHTSLLDQRTVVFDGQYDGIRRRGERESVNGVDGADKRYFRGKRMAVVYQRVTVVAIPAV